MQTTNDTSQGLSGGLVLLMAAGAGLSVASLYYSQPMLALMGPDIGASPRVSGLVPTLTQLGYALGLGLLAPLGDRYNRRHIIAVKAAVLMLALLGAALAPSIGMLLGASLLIGLMATMAQDIVPTAAMLAPDAQRGRTVGLVMTGLLLGILLSRVVSGAVAAVWGWRPMFALAAVGVALIGVAAWRRLPDLRPSSQLRYMALLGSLAQLWRQHGRLRRAALAQGLLALGFSAFWSTLALMLNGDPFHLGSAVAGSFGLAGAIGALAAPIAGRIADRRGPELVTRLGAGLVTVSFGVLALAPLLPPQAQLGLLVVATLGFDLGFQSVLISHQALVYGIDPGARSRLNAVFMVGMFVGMASGAALGSQLLAAFGWMGVVGLATLSSAAALAVRLWPARAGHTQVAAAQACRA